LTYTGYKKQKISVFSSWVNSIKFLFELNSFVSKDFTSKQSHLLSCSSLVASGDLALLTENFADVTDSFEYHRREADFQSHSLHVWQAKTQHFVLSSKEQLSICLHPAFIECPVGFQKPAFFLLPPKSIVWPILWYF